MGYQNPGFQILPASGQSTAAAALEFMAKDFARREQESRQEARLNADAFAKNTQGVYGDDYTSRYTDWANDPKNALAAKMSGGGLAVVPVESPQNMLTRTRAENMMGAEAILNDPNATLEQWAGAYKQAYGVSPPAGVVMEERMRRNGATPEQIAQSALVGGGVAMNANTQGRIKAAELMQSLRLASQERIAAQQHADRQGALGLQARRVGVLEQTYALRRDQVLGELRGPAKMEAAAVLKQIETDELYSSDIRVKMIGANEEDLPRLQSTLEYWEGQEAAHRDKLGDIFDRAMQGPIGPPAPPGRY